MTTTSIHLVQKNAYMAAIV